MGVPGLRPKQTSVVCGGVRDSSGLSPPRELTCRQGAACPKHNAEDAQVRHAVGANCRQKKWTRLLEHART